MSETSKSVRPPAGDRPQRSLTVDPLEGWDSAPAHVDDDSHQQLQWAVATGAAITGGVIGATLGGSAGVRVRRGLLGAVAGACAAVVGLQSWKREPEDDHWATQVNMRHNRATKSES